LSAAVNEIDMFELHVAGVSVGVSAFTLVAISLERYFAICRPLRSRRWQTVSHSYKMIGAAWAGAITLMLPIAIYQRVRALPGGARKCIEVLFCLLTFYFSRYKFIRRKQCNFAIATDSSCKS
jgi:7 transmembrane receptor (rhodopsin family)